MAGKIDLTIGEIQGYLRQMLESADYNFGPEQRYSLMSAMESMEFLKRLSPGLKKAMKEHKNGLTTRNTAAGDVRGK